MRLIKNKKRFLQNLAIGSMTFFSILSVYAATIAWLAANRNISNTGMNIIPMQNQGKLKKVSYYAFNTFEDNSYKYNSTPLGTYTYNWIDNKMDPGVFNTDPQWQVPMYDSMYKYNSLLMIFELNDEFTSTKDGDFYIRGITNAGGNEITTNYAPEDTEQKNPYTTGGGYLGARLDDGTPYFNLREITNPTSGAPVYHGEDPTSILMKQETVDETRFDYFALSSVARFQSITLTQSQYDSLMGGSTINISVDDSLKEENAFTTINNETDKYFFDQKPYLYQSKVDETFKYVGLIIDYSPDAVGYIYSTYLGDAYMNDVASILYFSCDWSLEVY